MLSTGSGELHTNEQVFVKDESTKLATHISEESSLVDVLRDHTEVEAILVIFDDSAQTKIEEAARQANCLTSGPQRRSSPPSGGPSVAKVTSGAPPPVEKERTAQAELLAR